jgi:prepilin-type N-terminal cleavage/methylation domain-containing protein
MPIEKFQKTACLPQTGESLMKAPSKGFTLIELAVVIAIIAILAAVAIPRFGDTTTSAERAMIKDMVSQLTSAAAIYTTEQGGTPAGFTDFVADKGTTKAISPKTITLNNFGNGACEPASDKITGCKFKKWGSIQYDWNNGQITVTATGINGNTATSL